MASQSQYDPPIVEGDPMESVVLPSLKIGAVTGKWNKITMPWFGPIETRMNYRNTMKRSWRYKITSCYSYPITFKSLFLYILHSLLLGGVGIFLGSFIGIIRSANPFIFTIASGLQWFAVGTIFWGA